MMTGILSAILAAGALSFGAISNGTAVRVTSPDLASVFAVGQVSSKNLRLKSLPPNTPVNVVISFSSGDLAIVKGVSHSSGKDIVLDNGGMFSQSMKSQGFTVTFQ